MHFGTIIRSRRNLSFPRNTDTTTSPLGGNHERNAPPIVIIRPHPLIPSVAARKGVSDNEGDIASHIVRSGDPSTDVEDIDKNTKHKQQPGRGIICPQCSACFASFLTSFPCRTTTRSRSSRGSQNITNMSNLVGDFSDDDAEVVGGGPHRVGFSPSSSRIDNGPSDANCVVGIFRELWESSELIFNNKLNWLLVLGPVALFGKATNLLGEAACFAFSGIALIPCAERCVQEGVTPLDTSMSRHPGAQISLH